MAANKGAMEKYAILLKLGESPTSTNSEFPQDSGPSKPKNELQQKIVDAYDNCVWPVANDTKLIELALAELMIQYRISFHQARFFLAESAEALKRRIHIFPNAEERDFANWILRTEPLRRVGKLWKRE